MPKRYEILGLEELTTKLPRRLDSFTELYLGPGNYPPQMNQRAIRMDDVEACLEIATYKHLQLDIGSRDVEKSSARASMSPLTIFTATI
ncbi:MAG: hypothetical protein L0228_11735 [Planctomycetes bacterium]|nr:hypothetical protein [Planctomycetota bacterium]